MDNWQVVSWCQARLSCIKQINSECAIQSTSVNSLRHMIEADGVGFCIRRYRKWGADSRDLLVWSSNRHMISSRPYLDCEGNPWHKLYVFRNRGRQEPVRQVVHQNGKGRLQRQIAGMEIKAKCCNTPIIVLACNQQGRFSSCNKRLSPQSWL